MSLLIVGLDATIVNVALPAIHHSLNASLSGLQWVVDAYTLPLASLLMLGGTVWGAYQWALSEATHQDRSTGTVMLAVLPFLMGFQLVLNALMYDVQFAQKTSHELLVNVYRRFPSLTRATERSGDRYG